MPTIDELQIEIQASSTDAASGIDALTATLTKLRAAVRGGAGLTATTNQLKALSQVVQTLQVPGQKIREIVDALKPLEEIGKSRLGAAINQLKKIPEVTQQLAATDMGAFAAQIQHVVNAVKPLSAEMEKVYLGFSKLPANIQKAINANAKLTTSNKTASKSYGVLGTGISAFTAKLTVAFFATQRIARTIGGFITDINKYVEDVNLFTVAMGDAAEKGRNFAQTVQDVLGYDAGETMRNLGLFQQLSTSFGIANEQAYTLSKNLTQLGYDYASFFNISIKDSFLKLQSAIAGELEPVRRLGKDISQARLQQELYALGIDATITSLNRADKALLTYIALMKQSTNEMGDAARTIMTPANALRVLQAQAVIASRAIGSVFIPMLMKILPVAIAVVKVIGEMASAFASFVGFEMPEIDYSTVGQNMSGISDELEGVADSAYEAEKQISALVGGFDELNILSDKTASGVKGISFGSILGGVELPQYDMLLGAAESEINNIAEKIKSTLDGIYKKIEPFIPALQGVAAGFIAAFSFAWLSSALGKIGGLTAIAGAITAIKTALATAIVTFAVSHNPITALAAGFSVLWGSLMTFLSGLSPFTKIAVAVVGLVTVFITAKNTIEELTKGNISFGDALMNLLPIFTVVEIALYGMFGPAGLIIGAIAAVAGAVIGFNNAQNQLQREFIKETFFDGVGVKLDVFKNVLINSNTATSNLTQRVLGLRDALIQNDKATSDASLELGILKDILLETGKLTGAETEAMSKAWDTMLNGMKNSFSLNKDLIFTAFSNSAKQAAIDLGYDVGVMTRILQEFQNTFNDKTSELDAKMQPYLEKLKTGVGLTDKDKVEFTNILTYANDLAVNVSESQTKIKEQIKDITKIDFENADEAIRKLSEIQATGNTLLGDLDGAKIAALTAIENMQNDLSVMFKYGDVTQEAYNAGMETFSQFATSISAGYERDKKDIEAQLSAVMGAIENGLNEKIKNVTDKTAPSLWENFQGALGKAFLNTDKDYTRGLIEKQVEDEIGKPIREKLIEMGGAFGVQANKETGKALMDGLAKGITDYNYLVGNAMTATSKTASDAVNAYNGINSPSTLYAEKGKYIMLGLRNGIADNSSMVTDAFKNTLNAMLSEMERFVNKVSLSLSDMLSALAKTMQSVNVSAGGSISFMPTQTMKIPKLAKGGVAYSPRVVEIGEYPGARSNPEIVAPQSTIYETVVEANNEQVQVLNKLVVLTERLLEKDNTVVVGDDVIGRANARYSDNRGVRLSKGAYADAY